MRLALNIQNTAKDLDVNALPGLYEEAGKALDVLLSGTGKGNDFIGWLTLADGNNQEEIAAIKAAAAKIRSDSEALVIIGIGGSYLGAKAALDFIKTPNYNALPKDGPDIYFIGNGLSADSTNEVIQMLGDRDFSINVISKSGTTTEPAVAFRIFRDLIEKKYGKEEAAKRIYATTDKARGVLKALADAEGYQTFVIPDNVGGRFSVFTPVGLLPLAVAGVDIDEMLAGAKDGFDTCKNADPEVSPAIKYAAVRNGLYRGGKLIEVLAAFEPALRFTGEWWKQLYGESEGKESKGLFPASVDFTPDLHSMGQYMQEGLRIILETFIKVENSDTVLLIPNDEANGDGLNFLTDKPMTWTNHQALAATAIAHMDGGVPNMTITIPDKSARSFGELVAFFELACGISGYMLDVNPFNQPGVEAYKINMFALLGKPGYEAQKAELDARL
ncbi:MAG: glucose-6-phosphate isomerase [Ruminococcaceae bacterium]|nr:glucose-6-phosphate isomerase [Oscillospiraceae bacterium]